MAPKRLRDISFYITIYNLSVIVNILKFFINRLSYNFVSISLGWDVKQIQPISNLQHNLIQENEGETYIITITILETNQNKHQLY